MKKQLILIILAAAVPLVSCSDSSDTESNGPNTENEVVSPVVTTSGYEIGNKSINLFANIGEVGTESIVDHGFVWSNTIQEPIADGSSNILSLGSAAAEGEIEAEVQFILEESYFFRPYVETDVEVVYGEVQSFVLSSSWTRVADLPGDVVFLISSFSIGEKGYVFHTRDNLTMERLNSVFEYSPSTNEWKSLSDFPGDPRTTATTFVINDIGYSVMGLGNSGDRFSEVWKYDPLNDTWTQLNDFPGDPLNRSSAMVFSDRVYIVGGRLGTEVSDKTWEYDPTNDTWTERAPYPGGKFSGLSTFVVDGIGYAGMGGIGNNQSKEFYAYDPANDSWSKIADFPGDYRFYSNSFELFCNGFIIGGDGLETQVVDGVSTTATSEVWRYDPIMDSWTQMPNFDGSPRASATTFKIGNTIYFGPHGWEVTDVVPEYINDFWRFSLD